MHTGTGQGTRAALAALAVAVVVAPAGLAAQDTTRAGGDAAARRAVGAMAARNAAFRDTVVRAIGESEFDFEARPRRSGLAERVAGGFTLTVSQPTGEFRRFARVGVGVSANAAVTADRAGVLGLRVEGGAQNYGRAASAVQNFGTLVNQPYQQVTSNNIFWGAVGPQLSVPLGPVRPYGFGTVGVASFSTSSRLVGLGLGGQPSQSFEVLALRDFATTLGYGGGMRVRIARGPDRTAVSLDLGARAHLIRSARYLEPGLLGPDLNPALRAQNGRANFVSYHIGLSAGGR